MEGSLRRNNGANAEFFYDRQSGNLSGASLVDQMAVYALQIGSVVTRPFGHRGYGWGVRRGFLRRRATRHRRWIECRCKICDSVL